MDDKINKLLYNNTDEQEQRGVINMSIAQQVNTILEQLPTSEQMFFLELVKRLSVNSTDVREANAADTRGNINSLRNFIKACEADPLSDDPIDEMLITERVNITRELDL